MNVNKQEYWADPLEEQYRAIFESISFIEQEIGKYSSLMDNYFELR